MASIVVSTTAQLLSAVKIAKSGDTILMKSGTYSAVAIQNINIAGNVTIKSADVDHQATLMDLSVKNSSGITFSNLDLYSTKDMPFQVLSSSNINMTSLFVHGTLNGSSSDDHRGLLVRDSSNITVTNSHFTELTDALSHLDSNNITISGNTFDLIRDNGVAGGGTSNLTIQNNYFTDFDHVGDIHPDAIQVWTTYTKGIASNVLIDGNVISRGSGTAIQGIYVSDDVGGKTIQKVTVTNNTVIGEAYNGILITGASGVTIAGNTVLAEGDQPSWIATRNLTDVVLKDNVATAYNLVNSTVIRSGNVEAGTITADLAAKLGTLLVGSTVATKLAALMPKLTSELLSDVKLIGFVDTASLSSKAAGMFSEVVVNGTSGADRLAVGSTGNYKLVGGAGNDTLIGGSNGVHHLIGGTGDDTYVVHQIGDTIVENAGEGKDTVYSYIDYTLTANVENLYAYSAGLTLHGNALDNMLVAASGGGTLYGEDGNDTLQGGGGNDLMYGGAGNDRLLGGDGDDKLSGGDGNDVLQGGNGNDVIDGGTGNDSIEGGPGADILTGGTGADTFTFRPTDFSSNVSASMDTITDFSHVDGDKIALSLIDANSKTTVDDAFKFIGSDSFHHIAGELRFQDAKEGAYVSGDTNGDGVADFTIFLQGVHTVATTDFYL